MMERYTNAVTEGSGSVHPLRIGVVVNWLIRSMICIKHYICGISNALLKFLMNSQQLSVLTMLCYGTWLSNENASNRYVANQSESRQDRDRESVVVTAMPSNQRMDIETAESSDIDDVVDAEEATEEYEKICHVSVVVNSVVSLLKMSRN